jgi:hypothetical protein
MRSPAKKKTKTFSNKNKFIGQGIANTEQTQELILRMYEYLDKKMKTEETKFVVTKEDVITELRKATLLPRSTLLNIINNGIKASKLTRNNPFKYSFDSLDKNIIKQIINKFYSEKTLPYMNDVYSRIKEQENLSFRECSLTTFYRLMKQMGFKLAKVGDV